MTKSKAAVDILKIRAHVVSNWDDSENEYCKAWFGKSWIPGGFIKCDWCKQTAVPFRGYIGGHQCDDCADDLKKLEGR